jgi:hypothetical protein
MFMRLGFSVAAHSDPGLLVVDEVLAVGDTSFQLKCFDYMRALQREGTSIVLVSHLLSAIRVLCPRVAVMHKGRLVFDGEPEAAIGEYYKILNASERGEASGPVVVVGRELRGTSGVEHCVDLDGEVEIATRVRFDEPVADPHVRFELLNEGGVLISTTQSKLYGPGRAFAAGEEIDVSVRFRARLAGGAYRLVTIITGPNIDDHLLRDEGPVVYVTPRVGTWGIADPLVTIEVDGEDWTWRKPLMFDGRQSPGSQLPR